MKNLDTFFKSKTGFILFAIFSLLLLNGLYMITSNRPGRATAGIITPTPRPARTALTPEQAAARVKLSYWANLSPYDKVKVNEFKARLPLTSKNLEITFAHEVNQFLVALKSESQEVQTELNETLRKNNMFDIYLENPALFSMGRGTTQAALAAARTELNTRVKTILDEQNVRGLAVNAQAREGDHSEDTNIPNQSDSKPFADFFRNLMLGVRDDPELDPTKYAPGQAPAPGNGAPAGTPNTGAATVNDCPTDLPKVTVPGAQIHYLESRANCITPTILVIHWSGGWGTAEGTANTLNQRGLRCHLGTDADKQLQYLDFYENQVERGSCTWGASNFTIDNEISGVYFDEVFTNPANENYADLQAKTERALASTCWAMKQYNIPADQIFGHFEMPDNYDKSDPGAAYINYFRGLAQQRCK